MSRQEIHSICGNITDWRIPRPLLYISSSRTDSFSFNSNYERNIKTIYGLENKNQAKIENVQISVPNEEKWFSSGCSSSSSSRTASSGSLLISPNNINGFNRDMITVKPDDTQSIASSTHFTLVNGITLPPKQLSNYCTKSRQLPVLVITMTIILFFGILAAVLLVEMRAMELRHPQ